MAKERRGAQVSKSGLVCISDGDYYAVVMQLFMVGMDQRSGSKDLIDNDEDEARRRRMRSLNRGILT
jgi:hypothetical protein